MRIAFINENSQKKKNEFLFKIVSKVCEKYHHEVFNFGVKEHCNLSLDYVGAGVLCGILLNSHVVDFVITGCASGQGVMISANAMPNVYCGLVTDVVDAKLFYKINAGNAISIAYGKNFGVGFEFQLESILKALFETEVASGYPKERVEIQNNQRQFLQSIKEKSTHSMEDILEQLDKDFLAKIIKNEYFEENFFRFCENAKIAEYLKNIIDAWEEEI